MVTRHADVLAVLTDPRCVVPTAPGGPYGTLAWLRGTVSRFSAPDRHPARRAIGVAALAGLDPDELRAAAARSTTALLDAVTVPATAVPATAVPATAVPATAVPATAVPATAVPATTTRAAAASGDGGAQRADVMALLARRVPLEVLAARLGLADPAAAVPAVTAVAAAYHPGAEPAAVARADQAVAALLALSPPAPGEAAANRIGLLVQAADATAGLIGNAVRHGLAAPATLDTTDLLAEVLRLDPPVRATRRVATAARRLGGQEIGPESVLLLRFDAANRDPAVHPDPDVFRPGRPGGALTFGAGPRGCPGERHAIALAAGVVEVLRDRCRPAAPGAEPVGYAPHPTLRVPTSLEVMFR
ncbi:cytochrome P450 [Micromonospora chaiyaphumensis]|uniref:Cytochrome P450 n=1 Tax=Micromonospora chaiyaphumensis TaxID=307119 RepID=A0A1C4UDY6_9ACTN|nr:cytochrome P450 [Micromonospora chaiyaphumensis]SCE69869.1 Cytochrome P450 [Micromonospora chaiyaphumensis]